MKLRTMDYLVCPNCGANSLFICETILQVIFINNDIAEGTLKCKNCDYKTIIIYGVPIVLNNYLDYLTLNKHNLLIKSIDYKCSSLALTFVQSLPDCIYGQNKSETWDSPFGVDIYIYNQYIISESKIGSLIIPSFYNIIGDKYLNLKMLRNDGNLAIDVGCNVGVIAKKMALNHDYSIGIDYSFNSIIEARNISLGTPYIKDFLKIPCSSSKFKSIKNEITIIDNLDYIVADAYNLPIDMKSVSTVSTINLIDILEFPKRFINEILQKISSGTRFILATPYYWRIDRNLPSEWILGENNNLAEIFKNNFMDFEIEDELWVINFYERYSQVWNCHVYWGEKN